MKQLALASCCLFLFGNANAQVDADSVANDAPLMVQTTMIPAPVSPPSGEVYKIKPAVDIPITAATTAYTLWGFSKIYGRDKTPADRILALDYNDINKLDRPTWDNRDLKAKDASDMLFYGSMPLPLIFVFDKAIRKDALKVGLLYLQAMSSFGVMYTSSAMIADRFRPYTYNTSLPLDERRRGGGRNSFMAGHPGLVATSTFFVAKVFSDYHPEWKNKWIMYSLAGGATIATGILRVKAGEHFPTDVMVGIPMGVLSGILIPHIHKNKGINDPGFSFSPMMSTDAYGVNVRYRF